MSVPGTIKARSSVEIDNSCNCFCFKRKTHKKRTPSEEKVDVMVQAGVFKRTSPRQSEIVLTANHDPKEVEYKTMPAAPAKGDPIKFPI